MGNNKNAFRGKKFSYREGGVVMMEQQFLSNVWSQANDPFSEPFKNGFIKKLVNSLSWRNEFFVDNLPSVKKLNHH